MLFAITAYSLTASYLSKSCDTVIGEEWLYKTSAKHAGKFSRDLMAEVLNKM